MDNTTALVSVVIPVYNVEKYISRCLDCVVKQTYRELEIIVVNDGSTDHSFQICEEYQKKDGRIQIVSQINQGLSQARNSAFTYVHGQYIVFIDSDDYIENNYIEKMLKSALTYDADIVVCNYINEYPTKQIVSKIATGFYDNQYAMKLLIEDDQMPSYVWNKIYKTELWKGILFPVGKRFEDTYVMHRVFQNAQKVLAINDVLYHYIRRDDSITGRSSVSNDQDTFNALLSRRMDLKATAFYHEACSTELVKMRATLCELMATKNIHSDFGMKLMRDFNKLYEQEKKFLQKKQQVKLMLFKTFPKLFMLQYKIRKM